MVTSDRRYEVLGQPFDPASRMSYSEQLAARIIRLISHRVLKPGDTLPSIRRMAELCGTSVKVPVGAFRRLQEKGYAKGHTRRGVEVLPHNSKVWRGDVILFGCADGTGNYFLDLIRARLITEFTKANWRVREAVSIHVDAEADFVVSVFPRERELAQIAASGLPCAIITHSDSIERPEGCKVVGVLNPSSALAEMAAWCMENGIDRVLQVANTRGRHAIGGEMKKAGVKLMTIAVCAKAGPGSAAAMIRNGFAAFRDWLSKNRTKLPGLIYCSDDHLALPLAYALSEAGVKVPEKVRFAAQTCRGNEPFMPFPYVAIEENPDLDARRFASVVLGHLDGAPEPGVVFLPSWFRK